MATIVELGGGSTYGCLWSKVEKENDEGRGAGGGKNTENQVYLQT